MDKKICEMVTNALIEEMQKGIIPWEKPWTGRGEFISHSTGRGYSLLNEITLGIFSEPGEFITFNQCAAEGGKVKKGAKSIPIVFWKQVKVTESNKNGEEKEKLVPMLKYYRVFNIKDCEGIEPKYFKDDEKPVQKVQPLRAAEKIVEAYQQREGIKIVRDQISNSAFYSPSNDYIKVPDMGQFEKASEYYSTLFHEIAHSTGHSSRLNRFTGAAAAAAFGSEEYSKEELIAEISAATINNKIGAETQSSFRNSAAYLQGWLRALKDDPTMIVAAAGKAEKAVEFIFSAAPDWDTEPGEEPTEEKPGENAADEKQPEQGENTSPAPGAETEKTHDLTSREKKLLKLCGKARDDIIGHIRQGDRFAVTSGFLALETPEAANLPRADLDTRSVSGVFKHLDYAKNSCKIPVELPKLKEINAAIAADRKERSSKERKIKPFLWKLSTGTHYNALYLADLIQLIPNGKAFVNGDTYQQLYIYAEGSSALLLPVRVKDAELKSAPTQERYKS